MTIHAISLDFDNCLAHPNYIKSTKKDIIASNQSLLNQIKAENTLYEKNIAFIGSSRQSKYYDDQSTVLIIRDKEVYIGSCYPEIQKVSRYINAQFDPLLLADIYGNLPPGTSFARALQKDNQELEHSDWLLDATKASILYAQIHKTALEYSEQPIIFDFYDDQEDDILKQLAVFYSKFSLLLPKNVQLRLYHYAGKERVLYRTIQGTGFIDRNYPQTIKDMAEIAAQPVDFNLTDVIHTTDWVIPQELPHRVPFIKEKPVLLHEVLSDRHSLEEQLAKLKDKIATLRKEDHEEAAKKAQLLYDTISKSLAKVYQGTLKVADFKNTCDEIIKDVRPELETHRGWSAALINLTLAVAGFIGLLLKGVINYATGRNFFFVHKTNSAHMLDALETTITKVTPHLG